MHRDRGLALSKGIAPSSGKRATPQKMALSHCSKKKESSEQGDLELRIRMLEEQPSSSKSSEEKWVDWDSLRNDVIDRLALKLL